MSVGGTAMSATVCGVALTEAQPAGVPVAVQTVGSPGVPPLCDTRARLVLLMPPLAASGVTLTVNVALPLAAIPLAVVTLHTRSIPALTVPLATHDAAVAPLPGAALLY